MSLGIALVILLLVYRQDEANHGLGPRGNEKHQLDQCGTKPPPHRRTILYDQCHETNKQTNKRTNEQQHMIYGCVCSDKIFWFAPRYVRRLQMRFMYAAAAAATAAGSDRFRGPPERLCGREGVQAELTCLFTGPPFILLQTTRPVIFFNGGASAVCGLLACLRFARLDARVNAALNFVYGLCGFLETRSCPFFVFSTFFFVACSCLC